LKTKIPTPEKIGIARSTRFIFAHISGIVNACRLLRASRLASLGGIAEAAVPNMSIFHIRIILLHMRILLFLSTGFFCHN
jgi:hypothetical protein